MAFRLRLQARGARRRKPLSCALRACRPGLRRSAGSTLLRGSPSSTDRLPAPRFRHSRGPAQRPLQSTAVVQLEVDMSSTMGLQSRSGACCTFTRTLFCLTFEPRHHSQEAACADADLRLRAGQLELERGWPRISRPIRTITPLHPRILLPCAICSHVAVAISVCVYEALEVAVRPCVAIFRATQVAMSTGML